LGKTLQDFLYTESGLAFWAFGKRPLWGVTGRGAKILVDFSVKFWLEMAAFLQFLADFYAYFAAKMARSERFLYVFCRQNGEICAVFMYILLGGW
jgi:hypothetical protein